MEQLKRPVTILNLIGELSPELSSYFVQKNIQVVEPESNSENYDLTHILTKDLEDFDFLNETYNLITDERHIISLTKMENLQNFVLNNGNLILDENWFLGPMGSFILDKYFHGHGGVAIGDSYPTFKEVGTFNVTNPFNTGEYLDRMVHHAFDNGIDGLTLKSYFDHLVMYLAGLKKKGKVGLPFEVSYGIYKGIFAVQMHFFSSSLEMMDVSSGLSSHLSKKAEEYFLNVAVQSSDFFDFSYMPEVNKIVITGLWSGDERIKFENRGLMLTTMDTAVSLVQYEEEGISSSLVSGGDISDNTDKVVVSGGEDNSDDETMLVKGDKELDDFVQHVKGKLEAEDEAIFIINGEKLDVEKVSITIASNVDATSKDKDLKVRSLGNKLPTAIKTGLFDFAKGLNKAADDLSKEDLNRFQEEKLPDIIKDGLKVKSLGNQNGNPNDLKKLEAQLSAVNTVNDKLKTQLKTLINEVKVLKETKIKMSNMQVKALEATNELKVIPDKDASLREEFQNKLNEQKALNGSEMKNLSSLLERESKLIADVKEEELKARKLQIETQQKDNFFAQELERLERLSKNKDLIVEKTKESFTKLVEKKEKEILDLRSKTDQLTKVLASGPSSNQKIIIKDLEKQNQNLLKQVEVYKNKISSLASNMQSSKSEDSFKDDARKLQMLNQQMKNQLDQAKKEAEKWQHKSNQESSQLNVLKVEKNKLEQLLKKAQESAKDAAALPQANDQELKRMQAQNQILETQLKDNNQKMSALEAKFVEAIKAQKSQGSGDDGSKVKLNQLENSVKKLTQDLIEARNQLGDGKKETNKLRQEKTALQNQLDKLKKEAEKAKSALPKKPNGKAA